MALAEIARMTPEADAEITAAALSDPDTQPLSDEELGSMRPMSDVDPELLDRIRRYRGQRGPQKDPTKVLVSLRLDRDLVDHLRATGPGWQTRVNDLVRKHSRLP
jgi:uncharacterized protein (DUF4415 family)